MPRPPGFAINSRSLAVVCLTRAPCSPYLTVATRMGCGDNSADYLSRASLCPERGDIDNKVRPAAPHCGYAATAAEVIERATYVNFIVEGDLPVTLNDLRTETSRDATLSTLPTTALGQLNSSSNSRVGEGTEGVQHRSDRLRNIPRVDYTPFF
ncbi:hypothetical protein ACJJTC_016248 [Scirpophaga incertulas]